MIDNTVSIITPLYNAEKYIEETAQSIFSQTYDNWEWIIVDDGSKDKSLEIVKGLADSRIQVFENEKNSGTALTRNHALRKANGRFIAFLDSDDLWLPHKLEKQIAFMNETNCPLTFHSYYKMSEDGVVGNIVDALQSVDYSQALKSNFLGCLTVMYDSHVVGKIEMVPGYKGREDWICWLEILKKIHKAQSLNEPLAKYRLVQNSLSAKKVEMLIEQYRVYREVLKLNPLQTAYYLSNYLYLGLTKYRT